MGLADEELADFKEGDPTLTGPEISELNAQVQHWKVAQRAGIKRLERVFKFKDFAQALSFTNKVGAMAEAEEHHPAILTEWGQVTVTWWTHDLGGLHRNDFIMAAKTDRIYQ
jgi:4a-hydroxytetrahydrobiopterin dehydratase